MAFNASLSFFFVAVIAIVLGNSIEDAEKSQIVSLTTKAYAGTITDEEAIQLKHLIDHAKQNPREWTAVNDELESKGMTVPDITVTREESVDETHGDHSHVGEEEKDFLEIAVILENLKAGKSNKDEIGRLRTLLASITSDPEKLRRLTIYLKSKNIELPSISEFENLVGNAKTILSAPWHLISSAGSGLFNLAGDVASTGRKAISSSRSLIDEIIDLLTKRKHGELSSEDEVRLNTLLKEAKANPATWILLESTASSHNLGALDSILSAGGSILKAPVNIAAAGANALLGSANEVAKAGENLLSSFGF